MKVVHVGMMLCLSFSIFCFSANADVVVLNNGQEVEGKIIDQTDGKVVIEFDGVNLTFYEDRIKSIHRDESTLKTDETSTIKSKESRVDVSAQANSQDCQGLPSKLRHCSDYTCEQRHESWKTTRAIKGLTSDGKCIYEEATLGKDSMMGQITSELKCQLSKSNWDTLADLLTPLVVDEEEGGISFTDHLFMAKECEILVNGQSMPSQF